jgi:nicotinamide mononucleotide adenylyltransferase
MRKKTHSSWSTLGRRYKYVWIGHDATEQMLTIGQTEYQPTAQVLDHFHHEINEVLGGIDDGTGKKVPAKIALLGGADLVETFVQPGVWSPVDLHHILVDCT